LLHSLRFPDVTFTHPSVSVCWGWLFPCHSRVTRTRCDHRLWPPLWGLGEVTRLGRSPTFTHFCPHLFLFPLPLRIFISDRQLSGPHPICMPQDTIYCLHDWPPLSGREPRSMHKHSAPRGPLFRKLSLANPSVDSMHVVGAA